MVPRTFPSTYQTANGETRMVVFFLSSVSGLRKWVDYIPVKFTMLETQVNNSYNNNGVILIDPLSSTTNRQAWVDYVPVFVDENDTAAWRVDANGFIPVGFSTKPTLNLDFAGTKTLDSRVTFTRASNATYFDSSGVLQTAGNNVARFDHNPTTLQSLGLLIEEQRTNSIRNNTMQGAVAGTPGTNPTNWDLGISGSGITQQIVGTGTEDGITYIDIKFSGTGSGSATPQIRPETTTNIVAAAGQTWTASYYLRIVGGSTTGTAGWSQVWQERNAAGTSLNTVVAGISPPTTSPLKSQRIALTRTLTDAGTERLTNRIQFTCANGVAVDITLRIGLPQLELGAFATSVIPTTVAAATRNADVATMTGTNFSSWYNATEGTLYADVGSVGSANGLRAATLSDGTIDNQAWIRSAVPPTSAAEVYTAGAFVAQIGVNTGGATRTALALKANDFAVSVNGGAAATDTSGALGAYNRLTLGSNFNNSGVFLNGHIRRIAYYPVRLSNNQLQALTR